MDAQLALMLVTDRIAESHRQAARERMAKQASRRSNPIAWRSTAHVAVAKSAA